MSQSTAARRAPSSPQSKTKNRVKLYSPPQKSVKAQRQEDISKALKGLLTIIQKPPRRWSKFEDTIRACVPALESILEAIQHDNPPQVLSILEGPKTHAPTKPEALEALTKLIEWWELPPRRTTDFQLGIQFWVRNLRIIRRQLSTRGQ